MVKTYGADTMRVYEMFMGPFDQQIAWSTQSMIGARRFIERVWKLQERVVIGGIQVTDSSSLNRIIHKTIKKVTDDILGLRFNTAISTLMIAVNELEKSSGITRSQFEMFLKLLAPFAPHVTDELWTSLGNKRSIHMSSWPEFDSKLAEDSRVTIAVQINGKTRGSFESATDALESDVRATALALPEVIKWTQGKEIKKVIVIKGKIVSIVTN